MQCRSKHLVVLHYSTSFNSISSTTITHSHSHLSYSQQTRRQNTDENHFPVEGFDETESESLPLCKLSCKDSSSRSCLYASRFYFAAPPLSYHRVPIQRDHLHRTSVPGPLALRVGTRNQTEHIGSRSRLLRDELFIFGFVILFSFEKPQVLLANALIELDQLQVRVLRYSKRGTVELPSSELRCKWVRRISSMVISYSLRMVLITDS